MRLSPRLPPAALLAATVSLAVACSSSPSATADGEPPPQPDLAPLTPDTRDPLAPLVDLRADVNRNGTVDLADPSEDLGEDAWDGKHGAIFLANLDDDEGACPKSGTDVSLPTCNDGADEKVNGADDAVDLAPLKTVPWPTAPDGAVGTLTVSQAAKPFVRLFKKQNGAYTIFHPETDTLPAAELRAGVELGLEGKDVVRDAAVWDGMVDITFGVKLAAATPPSDTVRLRLAPLVTQHHLSPPAKLFATVFPGDRDSGAMLKDLSAAVTAAAVPEPLVELGINDQWTQDLFEVATMSMPAPGGEHVITVYVRSANVENPKSTQNPLRSGGKVVFTFRGKDVAAVQQVDLKHSLDMDSLDSFGNLETIPPYTLDGKSYPLGRIIRGNIPSMHPDQSVLTMFESQKVQPPVYVDTSWLLVGHVDETISFVKAPTPRGWAVVLNDPVLAKTMLQKASADGHGSVKMFVGMKWVNDFGSEYSAEVTIDQVLADTSVMGPSATAVVEVDKQLAVLKAETGITDDEILRLPFLHWDVGGYSVAYQVGTVNSISLGDAHYGAAEPHGPVVGGVDIFKKQMETELAKVGITVHWIENWNLYHRLLGEVHCGSNTARQVSPKVHWWESGR